MIFLRRFSCPFFSRPSHAQHFADVIFASDATLFYATPLTQPLALERVWCLFEVMHTTQQQNRFHLLFGKDDAELLKNKVGFPLRPVPLFALPI